MQEFVTVAEALSIVLATVSDMGAETVGLDAAVGRVLRTDILARADSPSFVNSAMDGFAVNTRAFRDPPFRFDIVEEIPAGSWPQQKLVGSDCARIMTGAPLPEGADAVAPVEWCSVEEDKGSVTIDRKPDPGQHVRRIGDDIRQGQTVLKSGMPVTPLAVGSIASAGHDVVRVAKRPSMSIVTTGSEITPPGRDLKRGTIYDSNGPTLSALSASAGAHPVRAVRVSDDREATRRALKVGLSSDILLVSGGVSVGKHDLVKELLKELGVELLFWRVRQRPGKPLVFGTYGETLVFGLPGNPVSAAVCFFQYVYPAIRAGLGAQESDRKLTAVLDSTGKKRVGLHYMIPGIARTDDAGQLHVRSGEQGSHVFSALAGANCLIHLSMEQDSFPPVGTEVLIEMLPR